jgi:hypothetical protein
VLIKTDPAGSRETIQLNSATNVASENKALLGDYLSLQGIDCKCNQVSVIVRKFKLKKCACIINVHQKVGGSPKLQGIKQ